MSARTISRIRYEAFSLVYVGGLVGSLLTLIYLVS